VKSLTRTTLPQGCPVDEGKDVTWAQAGPLWCYRSKSSYSLFVGHVIRVWRPMKTDLSGPAAHRCRYDAEEVSAAAGMCWGGHLQCPSQRHSLETFPQAVASRMPHLEHLRSCVCTLAHRRFKVHGKSCQHLEVVRLFKVLQYHTAQPGSCNMPTMGVPRLHLDQGCKLPGPLLARIPNQQSYR
jgi:hypothetical protein